MKFGQQLSAKRMALVSGLGGLIAASGFLLPSPRHMSPSSAHYPFWLWTVLMFGFLLVGFGISYMAESDLKEGIQNERWSPEEVVSLQAVLESGLWVLSAMTCLIASAILVASFPAYRNVAFALMVVGQYLTRLGMLARRPRSAQTSVVEWRDFSPIRSEHWGER